MHSSRLTLIHILDENIASCKKRWTWNIFGFQNFPHPLSCDSEYKFQRKMYCCAIFGKYFSTGSFDPEKSSGAFSTITELIFLFCKFWNCLNTSSENFTCTELVGLPVTICGMNSKRCCSWRDPIHTLIVFRLYHTTHSCICNSPLKSDGISLLQSPTFSLQRSSTSLLSADDRKLDLCSWCFNHYSLRRMIGYHPLWQHLPNSKIQNYAPFQPWK